ncbi:hypothetical protein HDU97_007463 [Phlyctochytrium planicorne]|nr:hypothetical protein HDU97_007463 [Phlyctochytrium planicorne]
MTDRDGDLEEDELVSLFLPAPRGDGVLLDPPMSGNGHAPVATFVRLWSRPGDLRGDRLLLGWRGSSTASGESPLEEDATAKELRRDDVPVEGGVPRGGDGFVVLPDTVEEEPDLERGFRGGFIIPELIMTSSRLMNLGDGLAVAVERGGVMGRGSSGDGNSDMEPRLEVRLLALGVAGFELERFHVPGDDTVCEDEREEELEWSFGWSLELDGQ